MPDANGKQSRKWQLTINNPADCGLDHEHIKLGLAQLPSLTYYCMADEIGLKSGTPHTHIFFVTRSPVRFGRIKKLFPTAHIELAVGTAQENRDYITKSGKWADDEKADTRIEGTFEEWGELSEEAQGFRSDLADIEEMIADGMRPDEIMRQCFAFRKFERMIRSAYFDKRKRETPTKRKVAVHYIVEESGTGKSYTYTQLCEEHDEEDIFFLTDYENGGFDLYCGEHILFMDEYKGQFTFGQLLTITDCYKAQIHARYANAIALWDEIYITSVYPPEELYKQMVSANVRGIDRQKQLFRRITDITLCYIDDAGEYKKHTIPMSQYTDYESLKDEAVKQSTPDWVKEIDVDAEQGEISDLPF